MVKSVFGFKVRLIEEKHQYLQIIIKMSYTSII
jgi:hypothetical protein